MQKTKAESPLWLMIVVLIVVLAVGVGGLIAIGTGIYYIVDIVCVSADPASASAVCQDIN
jgi:hypothetical protein